MIDRGKMRSASLFARAFRQRRPLVYIGLVVCEVPAPLDRPAQRVVKIEAHWTVPIFYPAKRSVSNRDVPNGDLFRPI